MGIDASGTWLIGRAAHGNDSAGSAPRPSRTGDCHPSNVHRQRAGSAPAGL